MPNTVGPAAERPIPDTSSNAWKVQWDVYEEIGAPEINNFDELIDVMAQMKEKYPTDAEGNITFGTVLNGGKDGGQFKMMTQWYNMNGYENGNTVQPYLLEMNMVTGEVSSILEEDSMYRKGLEWYNEVYRRGLMDPDSINTDLVTQDKKIAKGLVMIPSGWTPGYKPYYYQVYVGGTNVYYNASMPYGAPQGYIVVNKNTTNLDACLKYLDLMIDPFTSFRLNFGPEGDAWYIDGEQIFMTDRLKAYVEKNNWSYTGYIFENGEEYTLFNVPMVLYNGVKLDYKDGEGNYRYNNIAYWSEFADAEESNERWKNWQKTTGYENWLEWLEAEGALYTEGPLDGVSSFVSTPDDEMNLLKGAVRDIVVNASWKMVYAETEEEFNAIWDQMIADCEGVGAKELQDWRMADIENAKAIVESLK